MSKLVDIINASESPQNLRKILEALGSDWRDYILMHSDKNKPFRKWKTVIDPNTGERFKVIKYDWDSQIEEEINVEIERLYWEEEL